MNYITVKMDLDLQNFSQQFADVLPNSNVAKEAIFDAIASMVDDIYGEEGGITEILLRDYIRFQLKVMSTEEVNESYGILDDEEMATMSHDEVIEAIENHLYDYTSYHGSFIEDDTTYFLFDEF